jgi:hypothetical protein
MNKLMFALVAATTIALVIPASAQVRIEGREGGVGVQFGSRHDEGRGFGRERCRMVTVTKHLPSGRTVSRTSRECGRRHRED